jgi:vitamin B12 transporter
MILKRFRICRIIVYASVFLTMIPELTAESGSAAADTLRPADYVLSYALPEEIVVTGTRTRIPIWQSPVPVTVIDGDYINRSGSITVGELLETNGAAEIRSYGNNGLATVSVRGLAADQTLVMINGVRINSPQNGLVDLSTIPLYGIKRIELHRGGASSLYGSNALGGIINIITEVPAENKSFAEVYAGIGSFGFGRLNVRGGMQSGTYGLVISAGTERAQNDFTFTSRFVPDGRTLRRINADYTYRHMSIDGMYRFGDEKTLRYFLKFSGADRGAPGPFVGGIQSAARQTDNHIQTAVTYSDLFAGRWLVRVTPHYLYTDILYGDPDVQLGGSLLESRSATAQFGGSIDVTGSLHRSLLLTAGTEISRAHIDADNIPGDVRRLDVVTFTGLTWKLPSFGNTRIILYPSLRYDKLRNRSGTSAISNDQLTWRIGLNIRPFAYDRFVVRASAGRNFKAPNFNDLYWMPGGNPELKPENSDSYDAGFRLSIPVFSGSFTVDGSVFYLHTRDRIVWQPGSIASIWSPVNFDDVRSTGMELYGGWSAPSGFIDLSVTYLLQDVYARFSGSSAAKSFLPYVPGETLHGNVSLTVLPAHISFQPRYVGHRYVAGGGSQYLAAYVSADLLIDLHFRLYMFSAAAGVQIKNLPDESYELIQNYPMPGREYRLTLRLSY